MFFFRKEAEHSAEYLKKGRQVFVEGRLTQDRWKSLERKSMSKVRVIAENVQFLGGGRGAGTGGTVQDTEEGTPQAVTVTKQALELPPEFSAPNPQGEPGADLFKDIPDEEKK